MAQFVSAGEKIDYTPSAATTAGTVVVQGDVLGITMVDIAANVKGALSTEGIWAVEKAAVSVAIGDKLWWDATNKVVTNVKGSNTVLAGKAVSVAASGDATVNVLLNEGPSA
jgi:predicted RecA/RadA family phage recombinase